MKSNGWYALYTRSRFEKRVDKLLVEQGICSYLPLVVATRRWSDRIKRVEVPLFNSYIFVNLDPSNPKAYHKVVETTGVVRFVSFEGKPVKIPDYQIEYLKRLSAEGYDIETTKKPIHLGAEVEIKQGPLKGIRGTVMKSNEKGKQLLVISLDVLDKNIQVKIPAGLTSVVEGQ